MMPSRSFRNPFLITALVAYLVFSVFGSSRANGALSREDYLNALKIADQKVARKKELSAGGDALSASIIKSLLGRYYQVGDSWEVAALRMDRSEMRMTNDPTHLKRPEGQLGVFRYEVIEVRSIPSPQVVIQVSQVRSHGAAIADPKVQRLTLTMNDQMIQSEKSYRLKGESQSVRVPPAAIRSDLSPLELFPLDVPDVVTAERVSAPELPRLPPRLAQLASQIGFSLPESGYWFEQDDFFGRPVQVLWRQGDPWPAYLKTPYGVAILMKGLL